MNKKDYNYIKGQIHLAEHNKKFYELLGSEYDKDAQFWRGCLNALNLLWLQAKNNYKLDK